MPSLVSRDQLATANALEMLGWTIGGIAGPALAGLLIGVIDATNVVLLDAASYAAFALALAAILRSTPAEVGHASSVAGGYSIWQAVRLMVASPVLLTTTLMFMAFNIGNGMLFVWLPLLTDQVLQGGARLYGFLLAVLAAGEVVAVVLAGTLVLRRALGTLICAAQFGAGMALLLVFLTRNTAGAVLGLALFGVCSAPMTIWAQTLRMRIIPENMRGRTFALLRMIMQGGNPIGGALGGGLAGIVAVPTLVAMSALLILSPALAGYAVHDLRVAGGPNEQQPQPADTLTEEDALAGRHTG